MTLDKLKVAARQKEQREEWRAAIDLYREAIRTAESAGISDPSLYNRIGDLSQKSGDESASVEAWEQAANRYGEQGFFNNAIALCGKILRLNPGRLDTYLELARFHARKRVIYDVRQNLTIYRDQFTARGDAARATQALEKFGAEFSSWPELRRLLDELLERDSDHDEAPGAGDASRASDLVFLDTADDLPVSGPLDESPSIAPPDPGPADDQGLVLEPTSMVDFDLSGASDSASIDLEPTSLADESPAPPDPGSIEMPDLIGFEQTAREVGETETLDGLESPIVDSSALDADDVIRVDGFEPVDIGLPPIESSPELELSAEPEEDSPQSSGADGIVFLDTADSGEDETADAPGNTPPESTDDPMGHRLTAQALLEHGDRSGGIAALEQALAGYEHSGDWNRAWQVATELVQAEPVSIPRYQARVEIAALMRDQERLCQSYFELGEALVRQPAIEKAVAVFRRVLELDELHQGARAALAALDPDRASEVTEDGYIDFGAMVIDDPGPRSTRMRTETTAVSEDEDETFREALAEFKRALDQNVEADDYETHYDLGVAFKEMGLLDEAIGAFQKALRSPKGRLRTSEALGQAFFEQGRAAVAEAVLRSVERGDEGDAEKIGVLYWLGRALEDQGKTRNAAGYYERVLAVDISFQDALDRSTRLASSGK